MVPKEDDETFGNMENTRLRVRVIRTQNFRNQNWEIPKVLLVQISLDQVVAYNYLLEFHLE